MACFLVTFPVRSLVFICNSKACLDLNDFDWSRYHAFFYRMFIITYFSWQKQYSFWTYYIPKYYFFEYKAYFTILKYSRIFTNFTKWLLTLGLGQNLWLSIKVILYNKSTAFYYILPINSNTWKSAECKFHCLHIA